MAWKVEISATAEKQLAKLDRTTQLAIRDYLRDRVLASGNPRTLGKTLTGPLAGLWQPRFSKNGIEFHAATAQDWLRHPERLAPESQACLSGYHTPTTDSDVGWAKRSVPNVLRVECWARFALHPQGARLIRKPLKRQRLRCPTYSAMP